MIDTLVCAAITAFSPVPQGRSAVYETSIGVAVHVFHYEGGDTLGVVSGFEMAADDMSDAGIHLTFEYVNFIPIEEQPWASLYMDGSNMPPFSYWAVSGISANRRVDSLMNIYVMPELAPNVGGFAYVPPYIDGSGRHDADGVWVTAEAYMTSTLTHEIGHFCGLYHVFQDVGFCGENAALHDSLAYVTGDLVADTPPIKPTHDCDSPTCLANWNPTRPWANYAHDNFMDYMDDSCRTNFTAGQIARMHNYLTAYRSEEVTILQPQADTNSDGYVGILDLLFLLGCLGDVQPNSECVDADFDVNGVVGTFDLLVVLGEFGYGY